MAALPPPPITAPSGEFAWLDWYTKLTNYLNQTGSIPWSVINFSGSKISDIQTRDHNLLTTIQGGTTGQFYHLTLAQLNALPPGSANANNVYAGPTGGGAGTPSFRALVTADIPDKLLDYTAPGTGFSFTMTSANRGVIVEPAGTIATGTIIFPASPTDGKEVTISSTQTITALTVTPSAGTTINGNITTIAANGFAKWYFRSATNEWYRVG